MTSNPKKITIAVVSITILSLTIFGTYFGYGIYTDNLFIQAYNSSQASTQKFSTSILNQINQKFPQDNKNQQSINKADLDNIITEFSKIDTLTKLDTQKFDTKFNGIITRQNIKIDLLKEFSVRSNDVYQKLSCTIENADKLKQLFQPTPETEQKANQANGSKAEAVSYIETQKSTFLEADKLDQKINECLQNKAKTYFYKSIADEFSNLIDGINADDTNKINSTNQKIEQLNNDPLYKSGGESSTLLNKLNTNYKVTLEEFSQKLETLHKENKDELKKFGFDEVE